MNSMIFFPFIGKFIALIIAAGSGLVQGALFFSDVGPNEALATRLLVSVPLAVASGAIFGYNFRRLWPLAIISVWGPLMFIVFSLRDLGNNSSTSLDLAIMAVPAICALLAGWLGAKLKALKNLAMLLLIIAIGAGFLISNYLNIDLPAV